MFDLEKELISISRFRQCPDDALREGTRIMVRRECRRAQTAGGRHLFQAKRPRLKWLAWVATAAAAALALMLVLSPAPTAQAAGYYTIDINPSVILRVDDGDIVLLASAGNAEASLLLDGLTLAGLDIGDALESIVRAAVQAGYFHVKGHVLVAHFGDTPGLTEQRAAQIVSSAAGESVSVMLLQSTKAEFESAGKAQKSAGIELLKKNARKLGLDETMDLSGMITALQERATQGHDAGSQSGSKPNADSVISDAQDEGRPNGKSQADNASQNSNNGKPQAENASQNGNSDRPDAGQTGKPDTASGKPDGEKAGKPDTAGGKPEKTKPPKVTNEPGSPKEHGKQQN